MGGIIPLGDATRRPARRSAITILLILVNVAVFVFELVYGQGFVDRWAIIPANITAGYAWATIVTAMFLHASWSHIIGNMIFLWAFGPEIEDMMGRGRYLAFYLLGGVIAMGAQVAASPGSTIPNLGASGAIAAVMGAFLVTYPRDRIKSVLFLFIFFKITFIPASLLIGVWFLMQLVNAGQIAHHVQTGGVAYMAHVAGFIFGAVTAGLFERRSRYAMYPDRY